jgi:mannose-6-phosphate isomerase-like protein (cupin superfamily)
MPSDPLAPESPMRDSLILIRHDERPTSVLPSGAAYRPIVGDDTGAGAAIRTGIQVSPPGYVAPPHSHPYEEFLTVLEGRGEAWLVDDGERERESVALEPGVTICLPADRPHSFRTTGDRPLVTFGIHASGKRIVNYLDPPLASPNPAQTSG